MCQSTALDIGLSARVDWSRTAKALSPNNVFAYLCTRMKKRLHTSAAWMKVGCSCLLGTRKLLQSSCKRASADGLKLFWNQREPVSSRARFRFLNCTLVIPQNCCGHWLVLTVASLESIVAQVSQIEWAKTRMLTNAWASHTAHAHSLQCSFTWLRKLTWLHFSRVQLVEMPRGSPTNGWLRRGGSGCVLDSYHSSLSLISGNSGKSFHSLTKSFHMKNSLGKLHLHTAVRMVKIVFFLVCAKRGECANMKKSTKEPCLKFQSYELWHLVSSACCRRNIVAQKESLNERTQKQPSSKL